VSAPPATQQRSAAIAWLRVIAIAGVVLIHVSAPVVVRDDLTGTPVELVAAIMNGAARFCVPLFVVVSGALVLRESSFRDGIGAFYRKRLGRLVPALIVWHVVYLVFRTVVRGQELDAQGLLGAVLSGRVYTALYFFWLILGLYLVAPLLWRAIESLTPSQRLLTGAVLVGLLSVWQATLGYLRWAGLDGSPGAQTIWTFWIPYVGFFVLGSALRDLTPTRVLGWTGLGLAMVGLAVPTWQVLGGSPAVVNVVAPFGYWSVFVLAAVVGLWLMGTWFWREGTWASRGAVGRFGDTLGSLTLGVFAIHLIVLYVLQDVLTPGLASGSIRAPGLVALAAATLVVSWTIAWGMSKVPGLRRLV
jgi:surface polysaccharide O-acyltransferase-like enzyme